MKPLDKVINIMTNNILPCGDKIKYCPLCEVLTDAIGYLKEYQQSEEIVKQILVDEENYPLSWEELRELEGKPVWIESDNKGHWNIIREVTDCHVMFEIGMPYHKVWQGDLWQAYRKERE